MNDSHDTDIHPAHADCLLFVGFLLVGQDWEGRGGASEVRTGGGCFDLAVMVMVMVILRMVKRLARNEIFDQLSPRTALGATTVLSIVNLGFGGKAKPKARKMMIIGIVMICCRWVMPLPWTSTSSSASLPSLPPSLSLPASTSSTPSSRGSRHGKRRRRRGWKRWRRRRNCFWKHL